MTCLSFIKQKVEMWKWFDDLLAATCSWVGWSGYKISSIIWNFYPDCKKNQTTFFRSGRKTYTILYHRAVGIFLHSLTVYINLLLTSLSVWFPFIVIERTYIKFHYCDWIAFHWIALRCTGQQLCYLSFNFFFTSAISLYPSVRYCSI